MILENDYSAIWLQSMEISKAARKIFYFSQ